MFTSVSARRGLVVLGCMACAIAPAGAQTTWYVDDDAPGDPGPGDPTVSDPLEDGSTEHPFDAVQEGVTAAADGDTVLILDGRYTGEGNREIYYAGKAITVKSAGGDPAACVIDCESTEQDLHWAFRFTAQEGPDSVLEGVTVRNAWLYDDEDMGAAVYGSGASPRIVNCVFEGNVTYEGGAVHFTSLSHPTVIGCVFLNNQAYGGGGMVISSGSGALVEDCTFAGNMAYSSGGALGMAWSKVELVGCTFYDNWSYWGSAVAGHSGYHLKLHRCILANNWPGYPVHCALGLSFELSCCDVHGNMGGDWAGDIAGLEGLWGNICLDPLFCDADAGDLRLAANSPCAPQSPPNPECDLIGAWPVGCEGHPGDMDGDADVDLADLAVFVGCLAGPGVPEPPPGCAPEAFARADTDYDSDVDLADFDAFQASFSGAR